MNDGHQPWEHVVAAVLVAAAHSDSDYAPVERETIEAGLKKIFPGKDAAKLRRMGEVLFKENSALDHYAKRVKRADYEDVLQIIRWMWRVLYADRVRSYEEHSFSMRFPAMVGVDRAANLKIRDKIKAECGVKD